MKNMAVNEFVILDQSVVTNLDWFEIRLSLAGLLDGNKDWGRWMFVHLPPSIPQHQLELNIISGPRSMCMRLGVIVVRGFSGPLLATPRVSSHNSLCLNGTISGGDSHH